MVANNPPRFALLPYLIPLYIWNGNMSEAESLLQEGKVLLERGISIQSYFLAAQLPIIEATFALVTQDYPRAITALQQGESPIGLGNNNPAAYFLRGKALSGMGL